MKFTVFCEGRTGGTHARRDLRSFNVIERFGRRWVFEFNLADLRVEGERIAPDTDVALWEKWEDEGRTYVRSRLACPECDLSLTYRTLNAAVADLAGHGLSEVPLSALILYSRRRR